MDHPTYSVSALLARRQKQQRRHLHNSNLARYEDDSKSDDDTSTEMDLPKAKPIRPGRTTKPSPLGAPRGSADSQSSSGPSPWIHTTPRRASLARISMANSRLPAYLIYHSENGVDQRFDLVKPVYTIGRREDRDIVLQCPQISKHHASIEKSQYGYLIRDQNSANGIQINGRDIEFLQYLKDGDRVQLGSVTLTFFGEQEITPQNIKQMMQNHPAFAGHVDEQIPRENSLSPADYRLSSISEASNERNSMISQASSYTAANSTKNSEKHLSLVTILPPEQKYEETVTVQAELPSFEGSNDFMPAASITDPEVLRMDYEKLRLAYELSKMGFTEVSALLDKTLDLLFSVLPVDRGVVMLVDRKTGMLTTDKVKLREGKNVENKEILLSYTILKKVFTTKSSLITSDAFEDPQLGKAMSIAKGNIRSVLCVPLIAHNQVHGILHLDSQDKINAFSEKDMSLVKAIANQTAIAIENCLLLADIEKEVQIRENLGRFLPPHVVDRVIEKGEEPVRKGGRQINGTILFADIRGFTQLSEQSSPQEIVELLNDFFERLVQIVFKYDGILDKYIGDCLMAAFGTLPENHSAAQQSELKAVMAALEFKVAIQQMNEEREKQGKEPISIGVGVNTGPLVAGFIGSSQRLEYTSIGDTVNTASRICSLANKNQVLISEFTLEKIKEQVDSRFLDNKQLKGKSTEIGVYEVHSVLPSVRNKLEQDVLEHANPETQEDYDSDGERRGSAATDGERTNIHSPVLDLDKEQMRNRLASAVSSMTDSDAVHQEKPLPAGPTDIAQVTEEHELGDFELEFKSFDIKDDEPNDTSHHKSE